MFFENNLPTVPPTYISLYKRTWFQDLLNRVKNRFQLLEAGLQETQKVLAIQPEKYHAIVSEIFRNSGSSEFDSMTPEELRDIVCLIYKLNPYRVPDRVEWKHADVLIDTAFLTTEEWEAVRCLGIGGSDAASILGYGFNAPKKVYYDKICAPKKFEKIDLKKEFRFEYGHQIEDMVIRQFCQRS